MIMDFLTRYGGIFFGSRNQLIFLMPQIRLLGLRAVREESFLARALRSNAQEMILTARVRQFIRIIKF